MINNVDIIRPLLTFEPGYFYFMQVIQRKKEVPDLGSNNRVIKTYYIRSLEGFDNSVVEALKLCETYTARAYIHLSPRSWKKVSFELLKHTTEMIYSETYEGVLGSLDTVIGRITPDKQHRRWVVDVDGHTPDDEYSKTLRGLIEFLLLETGNTDPIITIPSKNGYHFITRPFNLAEFGKIYPEIDIHKNNPTNLIII